MLCCGGFCLFLDTYQMFVTIKEFGHGNPALPGVLFSKCYFFRQVCDIINGDGASTKIFNWLFERNEGFGLLFTCVQLYSVAMFVQLGFATTSTVLSGPENSLLTETYQITSFTVSLCSSVLGTIITFVFFTLFGKWRDDIMIFGSAKYSCVLMVLYAADILLSCVSIILSFQSVKSAGQSIFPFFKCGMTLFGGYCLYSKRPNQASKDMLYFGECDSTVCVGNKIVPETDP